MSLLLWNHEHGTLQKADEACSSLDGPSGVPVGSVEGNSFYIVLASQSYYFLWCYTLNKYLPLSSLLHTVGQKSI